MMRADPCLFARLHGASNVEINEAVPSIEPIVYSFRHPIMPPNSLPRIVSSTMSRTNSSRLPFARCIHSSPSTSANPLPITGTGPAPAPPVPAASQYGERVERRRRQAEMIKQSQAARQAQVTKPVTALKKRFWKHVSVQTAPGKLMLAYHTIRVFVKRFRTLLIWLFNDRWSTHCTPRFSRH